MLEQVEGCRRAEVEQLFTGRRPSSIATLPYVRALREAATAHHDGEPMSVGRDGASDAVSFLRVGVPAVEFGPAGEGHHGPAEWVSVSSLHDLPADPRTFLRALPARLDA